MLWQAIRTLDLEARLPEEFEVTQPLFYGLWINTPLTASQCALLQAIFAESAQAVPRLGQYFHEFIVGLDLAATQRLPMHVCLAPPGHVDLGWITTFVHCRRCKAEGPLERWQPSYPVAPIACPVCGHEYSPAATFSQEEELFAEEVACDRCGRRFPVRKFPRETIDRLAAAHQYHEACEELAWMDRIAALYQQYPELEDQIRPAFLDLIDTDDLQIQAALFACVPFSELPQPGPPQVLKDKLKLMTPAELEVVEYLQHNHFSLAARRGSVEQAVRGYVATVESQRVPCACGGSLH